MSWSIDDRFRIPANRDVVEFIEQNPNLSAHDGVADALTKGASGLHGVEPYCPNLHAYAYVVLHAGRLIFGIAYGQSRIAFRLPPELHPLALSEGGLPAEVGSEWVAFDPWGDLRGWCKAAHDHVVRVNGA